MPGAVARVLVKPGDAVQKGQVLVVVEAMKMENEFKSPVDGVVREVHAVPGTAVEANTLLVVVGHD
jgi:biotin carboxyl carrier protein